MPTLGIVNIGTLVSGDLAAGVIAGDSVLVEDGRIARIGDRGQTGGLLSRNARERVDDADHRSEQSDEGGRGTDGREAADAALQFGVHDGFSTIQFYLLACDPLVH